MRVRQPKRKLYGEKTSFPVDRGTQFFCAKKEFGLHMLLA